MTDLAPASTEEALAAQKKARLTRGALLHRPLQFFEWHRLRSGRGTSVAAYALEMEYSGDRFLALLEKFSEESCSDDEEIWPNPESEFGKLWDEHLRAPTFTPHIIARSGMIHVLRADGSTFRSLQAGKQDFNMQTLTGECETEEDWHEVQAFMKHSLWSTIIMSGFELSLPLHTLEVRGRPGNPLAVVETLPDSCFAALLEVDVEASTITLEGVKVFDVEIRVPPDHLPADLLRSTVPVDSKPNKKNWVARRMTELKVTQGNVAIDRKLASEWLRLTGSRSPSPAALKSETARIGAVRRKLG